MNTDEIIIYQSAEGNIKLDVRMEGETVWLNQVQIATLFNKGRSTIAEHIQNVFEEGELNEKVVCREFRQASQHGAIPGKTLPYITKHRRYYKLKAPVANFLAPPALLWAC